MDSAAPLVPSSDAPSAQPETVYVVASSDRGRGSNERSPEDEGPGKRFRVKPEWGRHMLQRPSGKHSRPRLLAKRPKRPEPKSDAKAGFGLAAGFHGRQRVPLLSLALLPLVMLLLLLSHPSAVAPRLHTWSTFRRAAPPPPPRNPLARAAAVVRRHGAKSLPWLGKAAKTAAPAVAALAISRHPAVGKLAAQAVSRAGRFVARQGGKASLPFAARGGKAMAPLVANGKVATGGSLPGLGAAIAQRTAGKQVPKLLGSAKIKIPGQGGGERQLIYAII